MESDTDFSYNGSENGLYKVIDLLSNQARLVNCKSIHKASAVWDLCTDNGSETIMSNGSSGVCTPSIETDFTDAEFTDAESHTSSLSPSPENSQQLHLKVHVMEALISSFFSTVSTVRKAYGEVQAAHDPFDAYSLQISDRAVVAELKKFSDLKQAYKKRLVLIGSRDSEGNTLEVVEGEIDKQDRILASYEALMKNFHSEIQSKDAIIESLQDKLTQMTLRKVKLEKQVKRLEQKVTRDSFLNTPMDDASPSPQLLELAVFGASEASRTFAKLLMSLMNVARWDLDAAANSIEPGIKYLRASHRKYVFESYICQRMLNDFENNISFTGFPDTKEQCFKEFLEMRAINPHETGFFLSAESSFAKYCLSRFLHLIHPKMEESFFGNLEHRKQISSGIHPHSQFYQSYLKLAKAMWMLRLLAFSFKPNARIFQIKRNTEFSPLYMESVGRTSEMGLQINDEKITRVALTVMPGFRLENVVIKCQVYITASRPDNAKTTEEL